MGKSDNDNREAGMTLMEGLAVLGIMMIVLVLVSEIFGVSMNLITAQLRRTDTSSGAIHAVRRLTEQARGASSVVDSHVFDSGTYTTDDDTLVLQIPSIDSNGDIIPAEYDYVAFYRDATETSKVFSVIEPSASSIRPSGVRLMSDFNDTMIFRYNDPDESEANRVSVYFANSREYRERSIETEAWTSIFLRNRQ